MTTITITFNPDDPADLEAASRHLAAFTSSGPSSDVQNSGAVSEQQLLRDRVTSLIRGYGEGRHNYLRVIAAASPSPALYADIEALFATPKAIGGTHSSIERSWRAMGGPGELITTDAHGNSLMSPTIAPVVLEVLDEFPPTGGEG